MELIGLFKLDGVVNFLNVDTGRDTPLYIDPMMIRVSESVFGKECLTKLDSFWKVVRWALEAEAHGKLQKLFSHMKEENATHLWVCFKKLSWKGVWPKKANDLLDAIIGSNAIKQGLVAEILDMNLFVENIGPDNISDMVTNIIKRELCIYTQDQCKQYGIPTKQFNMWFYRNSDLLTRKRLNTFLPTDEKGKPLIFVPRIFVSDYRKYSWRRYFNLTILDSKLTEGTTKRELKNSYHLRYTLKYIESESILNIGLLKKFKERVYTEFKEMLQIYWTHDSVFCLDFRIGKAMLRYKVFQEAIKGLKVKYSPERMEKFVMKQKEIIQVLRQTKNTKAKPKK